MSLSEYGCWRTVAEGQPRVQHVAAPPLASTGCPLPRLWHACFRRWRSELAGQCVLRLEEPVQLACRIVRHLLQVRQTFREDGRIGQRSFQPAHFLPAAPPGNAKAERSDRSDLCGCQEQSEGEPAQGGVHSGQDSVLPGETGRHPERFANSSACDRLARRDRFRRDGFGTTVDSGPLALHRGA